MRFFAVSLLFIISLKIISCSTYEPFTPPADFDPTTYLDPRLYGGDPVFSININAPLSTTPTFTPVTIDGGLKKALQGHSFRRAFAKSQGGGATLRIYVDSTGSLTQIERINVSSSTIARELEKMARKIKFNPAIHNRKTVNSFREMEIYMAMYN